MKFVDALGNIKFGKAMFFGNNIQMSEQADGIVTINAAVLSGTGSKLSLLGDVLVSSVQDDQFVRWNAGSSLWINQFITAADIGAGTFKAGDYIFPNNVTVSGKALINKNLDIIGSGTINGALLVSGTTTLIGSGIIQVGQSSTFAKWPQILFIDPNDHAYSGTSEASYTSFSLKANSCFSDGQSLKIKGVLKSDGAASAFSVKIDSAIVVSGTLGPSQATTFESTIWKIGTNQVAATWTFYSGTSSSVRIYSSATLMYGWNITIGMSRLWSQDLLIDFRGNNFIATNFSTHLFFAQISYESS